MGSSAPSAEEPRCALVGLFGILVQLCLGLCMAVLVLLKWRFEALWYGKRRRFLVFALDISKQLVGAMFIHGLNLAQAFLFQKVLTAGEDNQCVWYLIGVICDCGFSTVFCAAAMDLSRPFLLRTFGMDVGNYASFEADQLRLRVRASGGDAPDPSQREPPPGVRSAVLLSEPMLAPAGGDRAAGAAAPREPSDTRRCNCQEWLSQTGAWCCIVLIVRLSLMVPVFLLHGALFRSVRDAIFVGLDAHGQMLMALVVAPMVGNVFQFTVVDHFLKK